MSNGTIWWIGIGTAAVIGLGGCDANTTNGKEPGMVRGTTPFPSVLIFACDNGKTYETHSRPYGNPRSRFSLTLPRESICRLWIKSGDTPLRSVIFYDYRGNLSPLIYLKSPRIDLGRIDSEHGEVVAVDNDDILLVAGDQHIPETSRKPERSHYFGKIGREKKAGSGS